MDKKTYKQTIQTLSTQVNNIMRDVESLQKKCRADKEYYRVTALDFVLHDLEEADIELCIELDQLE